MKLIFALLAAASITGCATTEYDTSNLSDSQRAMALAVILGRQQPQPYIVPSYAIPAQPVYQAPARQMRSCQWQTIGNMTHYQCY